MCKIATPSIVAASSQSYLEPDILECKVKWALGSISKKKASVGDGIPVELFQILKDDAVKVQIGRASCRERVLVTV